MSATPEPEKPPTPTPESAPQDRAPKSEGLLSFPNPSGKTWTREEPEDRAPRGRGLRTREGQPKSETPLQRRKRLEKRIGKTYMAVAKGVDGLGMHYPSQVLVSQSTDFVDAVMEVADEDARIMDWLDSKIVVSAYWKLGLVGLSIAVPIAAYYGFAPEWSVEFFDVPALPEVEEDGRARLRVQPQPGDESPDRDAA